MPPVSPVEKSQHYAGISIHLYKKVLVLQFSAMVMCMRIQCHFCIVSAFCRSNILQAIQKNLSKQQSESIAGEKNSQESAQKKNLSNPKASTYRTSLNKYKINAIFYTRTTLRRVKNAISAFCQMGKTDT